MSAPRSATVIGVGLIGGSLARDLKSHGVAVRGWDADRRALDAAVAEGVVEPIADDLKDAGRSDLVVLAVPVRSAPAVLARIADSLGADTLVTDVGSTKCSITHAAADLGLDERFVGSHPLAGDHRSGWTASRSGLFAAARVFLTPLPDTPERVVARAAALWESVGARPEVADARTHDRWMAWISHLPQALSTALGLALHDAGVARAELGPGGRDVARLAGSSAAMWADILADNPDEVVAALRAASSRIGSLTAAVERGDVAELRRMLQDAADWAGTGDGAD